MAAMDTVQNSTARGDEDPLSPTTLILNSLRKRGIPINADNIRRAVIENARDSDIPGPDPVEGLRNTAPSKDETKTGGGGNRGGGGENLPIPPLPQTTSAQPRTGPLDINIPSYLEGLGGAAGLGGGAYALYRYLSRMPPAGGDVAGAVGREVALPGSRAMAVSPESLGAEYMGRGEIPPTGRTIDVPGAEIGAEPRPQLGFEPRGGLPPGGPPTGTPSIPGPAPQLPPPPSGSPLPADVGLEPRIPPGTGVNQPQVMTQNPMTQRMAPAQPPGLPRNSFNPLEVLRDLNLGKYIMGAGRLFR